MGPGRRVRTRPPQEPFPERESLSRRAATAGAQRAGAALLAACLACGARAGSRDDAAGATAVYPWEPAAGSDAVRLPGSCAEDWTTVYESDAPISGALAVHAGELIFAVGASADAPPEVLALDISGAGGERAAGARRRRLIRSGGYDDVWLEGGDLLLWTGDALRRVPLAGGNEALMLDLRGSSSMRSDGLVVREDAIYWTAGEDGPAPLELWRQARAGGAPEMIASIDRGPLQPALAVTSDRVIVAGGESALAMSLSSGATQTLDVVPEGSFAGVDGLGAYHEREANRTPQGGHALEFEIRRAPADGSPSTRLWRGSAGQRLGRLWPAESGWLAIGAWYLFDGTPHAVIAHIDESGEETLVACNRGNDALLGRPVYSEGAFYAVTQAGNRRRVVEIRLPGE